MTSTDLSALAGGALIGLSVALLLLLVVVAYPI